MGPFIYTVSTMHCMTVSLGLDGEGLGTVWGEQNALRCWTDAGFTEVEVKEIEADLFNNYYVATKDLTRSQPPVRTSTVQQGWAF